MKARLLLATCIAGVIAFANAASAMELRLSGVGNTDTHKLFNELAKGFSAGGQHTAKYTAGPREMEEGVQQLLRDSLVGAEMPHIYLYAGNATRLLADRGMAVPLNDMMAADVEAMKEISPSVPAGGQVRNKTYGFSFGISMPMVLFNSALVEKAGGNPAALPQDWTGILDLGRKVQALGAPNLGAAIEYDNGAAFSWLYLLQSHGGTMMDTAESKLTFDGPEGLAALNVLQQFGSAGQGKADMTRDQLRQAFGAGTVGILVGMSSLIPRYEQQADGRFKVLAVRMPMRDGGGRLPSSSPIAAILAKDTATQKAAFEFLKFVVSPQGQTIVARESGYEPINAVAVQKSPELRALIERRSYARALLDSLPVSTGWFALPGTGGPKAAKIFNDNLRDVVVGKSTPQVALASMKKDVELVLKE